MDKSLIGICAIYFICCDKLIYFTTGFKHHKEAVKSLVQYKHLITEEGNDFL